MSLDLPPFICPDIRITRTDIVADDMWRSSYFVGQGRNVKQLSIS